MNGVSLFYVINGTPVFLYKFLLATGDYYM